MAAAAKKTRKELLKEPDEFITLSSRMVGFIATYKKIIGYICFGVLLRSSTMEPRVRMRFLMVSSSLRKCLVMGPSFLSRQFAQFVNYHTKNLGECEKMVKIWLAEPEPGPLA